MVGTLDFARELTGQFTKLASDDAKDRKKQAKREQQEKARQELAKVWRKTLLAGGFVWLAGMPTLRLFVNLVLIMHFLRLF